MRKLLRRITFWLHGRQASADLAEEIETHRSLRQARFEESGLSSVEASYASHRALGNMTLAHETARSIWIWPWIDALRQDVAYAFRTLVKNPGFAAAVIAVTSLGIGASTTVFGLIDGLILKPLPVHRPDQLVYFTSPSFSDRIYEETRRRTGDMFSGFFAWNLESVYVDWHGQLEPAEILMASGDFYSTLGVTAATGRVFSAADDQIGGGTGGRVAVISYQCWQQRFGGDPSAIGRTVRIAHEPFTVIGVTPAHFFGVAPGLAPEITVPLATVQSTKSLAQASTSLLHLMGRLRDSWTVDSANAALQPIWTQVLEEATGRDEPPDRRAKYLGRRTSLASAQSGFSRVTRAFAEPLWLLFALVGLLFVVSCASAANLMLARSTARRREIAVRLAIGASRSRVMRQLITEAFVWTALAAAVAVPLSAYAGSRLVGMLVSRDEPIVLDASPDWRIMLFALALTFVTVILCAVLPALRSAATSPGATIKQTSQPAGTGIRRLSLGNALVVSQVAVTMVLLVGAALLVRSLTTALAQDTGFDRDRVLVIASDAEAAGYKDDRCASYYAQLQERLRAIPGVETTSVSMMPPISNADGYWTQSIAVDGAPMEEAPSRYVFFNAVSPGYFRTVGIQLLQGRDFADADSATNTRVVVVNESLARRFFPEQNPIGRRISIGRSDRRQNLEIVGVVRDAKYQTLQEPARRIAYFPVAQHAATQNLIAEVRAAGLTSAIFAQVGREARAIDPRVPIRIESVTERISDSLVKERVMALLASGLGVMALTLACAGLYGLLAYTVSRRTNEIGLRLALGATQANVRWTVLRDSLLLAAVGVTIGGAAALTLGRYVRTLLFQIQATDAVSLAASVSIMIAVAILAGWLPARRAASVDPVVALKSQ